MGLTPGARQASDALRACRAALLAGEPLATAAAKAKSVASFSGPLRRNLVAMLDAIGIAGLLGIATCATLWTEHRCFAHFTSAVRYPLFVDGANWSGTPDVLRTSSIRHWLEEHAPSEFAQLGNAILIPLGDAVTRALFHLSDRGCVRRDAIVAGIPHPSGANAERISCFLGRKAPELASSRTDGNALAAARLRATKQVAMIALAPPWAVNGCGDPLPHRSTGA